MSSAGSESPHSNQPSPNPPPDEVTLEKLCKKGATVTRASELLDELTSKFSEFRRGTDLSNGTTALCAFIASEQLENKDVSVGLARTSSGLTWDQFWLLLKEVQDALVNAASQSSSFKYSRLPAYTPPCDTCESKHFECVRKIAPSTKCQVCSIRKKVCTRQDGAQEKVRKPDESKATPDDDWLSDLDSEPEKTKELIRTIKQPRSPSPSAQLDALLNDIDESKKLQIPPKAPSSPALSPKWTTLEDGAGGSSNSTRPDRPRSHDADFPPSLKRKLESSSDSNGKKRHNISPSQDFLVSSQNDLEKPSRSLNSTYNPNNHPFRGTVLQKGSSSRPNDKKYVNGNGTSSLGLSAPAPRKYPRPLSPTSSDDGHPPRSSLSTTTASASTAHTHKTSSSSSATTTTHRPHPDSSTLLRQSLHTKAHEIITHVEAHGCAGIALRLHILDMKTRLVELDRLRAENRNRKDMSSVLALEGMVRRAGEAVVKSMREDGCADVELRLLVLDLDTRLVEMDKER